MDSRPNQGRVNREGCALFVVLLGAIEEQLLAYPIMKTSILRFSEGYFGGILISFRASRSDY